MSAREIPHARFAGTAARRARDVTMHVPSRTIAIAVVFASVTSHGATQLVLGRKFQVKEPGGPATRKIAGQALEKFSNDSILGDPTQNGATLEVIAHGGTDSDQTFTLPKEGWSRLGSLGFKYSSKHAPGAVKKASIKLTPSGIFQIKVLILGKNGPVDVVPPNPGDDGGFILSLASGDSYCVMFGGAAGGREIRDDGRQWYVTGPVSEACFGTTTTTAGATTTTTTAPATTTTTVTAPATTTTTAAATTTTTATATTTTTAGATTTTT